MDDTEWLAERFEEHRARLRALSYRMLGSLTDADDAVQEAWLRLNRTGSDGIDNLGGWLTTVTARVCLNMLRSRQHRGEEPLREGLPDPVVHPAGRPEPEEEALMADSVSLALLVVLDTLSPSERLAFVLHDMFDLPFDEIAPMVGKSPAAARQLASRARRRVQGARLPDADPDPLRQRQVVDAFYRAARAGDFEGLLAVLDPDVVLRADFGPARPAARTVVRGAAQVAGRAVIGARPESDLHPAIVNGGAGAVVTVDGAPYAVMGFTVVGSTIAEIDIFGDPARVGRIVAETLGG